MMVVAQEEAGIDGGGGDRRIRERRSRERQGLSFGMKNEMT
jgi:hypothetical protein